MVLSPAADAFRYLVLYRGGLMLAGDVGVNTDGTAASPAL
jgi:hypothetical protein